MKYCPCGGKTMCLDSRPNKDGNTKRRYKCSMCNEKYYTVELRVESGRNTDTAMRNFLISEIRDSVNNFLDEIVK